MHIFVFKKWQFTSRIATLMILKYTRPNMGGLLAFRVGDFDNTAEREQFRYLCEQLKTHYENSNEFCVFAGNYNIGCELDALFIKKDAIIAIEFKNYGGKVVANENGEWTCDGTTIKGGSRKTVLQQARINHSIIKKELKVLGVSPKNIKDVPTLIVFNQPIEITNHLSATNKSWLHITDNKHFIEKLDDIVCPSTDLNPLCIVNFAETLNLNPFFLSGFSNALYDKSTSPIEKIELFEEIKKCESLENKEEQTKHKNTEFSLDNFIINDEDSIALLGFTEKIVKLFIKFDEFSVKILDGRSASAFFNSYGVQISHKYVVTISAKDIGEYCAKLSKFTNHNVRALSPVLIYWEEGAELASSTDSVIGDVELLNQEVAVKPYPEVVFRKSKTILPHWLDRKIYNDLRAIYAPEHDRYEYNLDLNEEELKVYLGTYFPRSYAEMFCIVDNLLQNKVFAELLDSDGINVLDCGCGTGGEIIGLITAIGKHMPKAKINVTAIDGNEGALEIFKDIIDSLPKKDLEVRLTTLCQTYNSEDDLVNLGRGKKDYHFILCDKMMCELISKRILPSNGYATIAKYLSPNIQENGVLVILDVTTKDEHTGLFYPQLMNSSLNEYIRNNEAIVSLLPLSCACNEHCKELCFIQQTFSVSHSRKSNDESRVCYRVLCRKSLKSAIMQEISMDSLIHIIHPIKFKQNDESAICCRSKDNKIAIDTFNINL